MDTQAAPLLNKDFLCLPENYPINQLIHLFDDKKSKIVLVKNGKQVMGFIRESNSYLLKLINKNNHVRINDVISKQFIVSNMDDSIIDLMNNMFHHKAELIIIIDKNKEVIGVLSNEEIIRYLNELKSKIIESNRKVRHDLRGSLFTLNTSILILEKDRNKFEQISNIIKKTTQSIGAVIESWKANDALFNVNIDYK